MRVADSLSKPKYKQGVKLLSVTFTRKAVTILVSMPCPHGKVLPYTARVELAASF